MKLAIVGSRGFKPLGLVVNFVNALKSETKVVSGDARGVDQTAIATAKPRLQTQTWPANWSMLGKKAGPLRNKQMIATVDGLVAFWDGSSRGTFDAIQQAADRRIWLRVYYSDGSFRQIYDLNHNQVGDLK